MNDTLEVRVGETRVGVLERFEDESQVFSFDSAWLSDPERPVLGQFFEDRKPEEIRVAGPMCWFAHLLPQGPLRRAITRRAGIDEGDVFSLLYILGEDLPGAVRMLPTRPAPVRRVPAAPPASSTTIHLSALAGVQWKLSVRPGERGLVLPLRGETGSWIAKFHDPNFPELPRIEFATMCWAKLSGVRVPPLRLGRVEEIAELPAGIPTGNGTIYLIERFDRGPDDLRIHMEDMGQILDRPPGDAQFHGSYEQIAAVLAAVAPQSVREYCERLVFCLACGNTDAHLKNWSVVYPDRRHAVLSPAYDIVAAVLYPPRMVGDKLALTLGGADAFESVTAASFQRLAGVSGLDFAEVEGWVRAAATRVVSGWNVHADELAYTADERRRLEAHMARVPLLTAS